MKASKFIEYWNNTYPLALPLGHELRLNYPDLWFRIHSLPLSKRYANTPNEYEQILVRQNQLMNDLFDEESELIVCFGMYSNDLTNQNYQKIFNFNLFQKILKVDLQQERPEQYDAEIDLYANVDKWAINKYDDLLKAVADDHVRVIFICPTNNSIVAPYDGGCDIIVDSEAKRNELKVKYKSWLSPRDDGL